MQECNGVTMNHKTGIKDLIDHLMQHRKAEVPVNGFLISVELAPVGRMLSFKAVVYQGYNYIPPSVRHCTSPSFIGPASTLRTGLLLDEESFSISLNFHDPIPNITQETVIYLMEEFSWVAEEWRQILEDNDQRDLIHIHAK